MDKEINEKIMVKTTVNENVKEVWGYWTEPEHITKWNQASDDWCTTFAENDLTAGGKFLYRMEAKDKSDGFEFTGTYTEVIPLKSIVYILDDGRKVNITFTPKDDHTEIIEIFEGEKLYSFEHQQQGWQSILNHFKEYTEITSR